MEVYKLAAYNDTTAIEYWLSKKGIYGDEKIEFTPMIDNSGNVVCSLAYGSMEFLPFIEDVKQCEQIEFVPKQINLPR